MSPVSPVNDAAALGRISAGPVTEGGDGHNSRHRLEVLDVPLEGLPDGLPGVSDHRVRALSLPDSLTVGRVHSGADLAHVAGHVGDGLADLLAVSPAVRLVHSGALALHHGVTLAGHKVKLGPCKYSASELTLTPERS